MAGQADEGVHFIQFGAGDVGQWILLAVHNTLLQGQIQFPEGDLFRAGVQSSEHIHQHGIGWDSYFHTGQIGWGQDRAFAIGDMTYAVVPPVQRDQTPFLQAFC